MRWLEGRMAGGMRSPDGMAMCARPWSLATPLWQGKRTAGHIAADSRWQRQEGAKSRRAREGAAKGTVAGLARCMGGQNGATRTSLMSSEVVVLLQTKEQW